jgi:hypothetical protein
MAWMVGVRFPAREDFSLLYSVETDSETHTASYPMGTGGDYPSCKAAGT